MGIWALSGIHFKYVRAYELLDMLIWKISIYLDWLMNSHLETIFQHPIRANLLIKMFLMIQLCDINVYYKYSEHDMGMITFRCESRSKTITLINAYKSLLSNDNVV